MEGAGREGEGKEMDVRLFKFLNTSLLMNDKAPSPSLAASCTSYPPPPPHTHLITALHHCFSMTF